MKKFFCILVVALVAASCSPTSTTMISSAKLVNSATHSRPRVIQPVTTVLYADLDVSPTKLSYFFIPSKTVVMGGYDNVINSAVREALYANGDADVLVAMETQIKYNSSGDIESVIVTGYPAKYTNFRSPSDDVLQNMSVVAQPAKNAQPAKSESNSSILGGLKIGKK